MRELQRIGHGWWWWGSDDPGARGLAGPWGPHPPVSMFFTVRSVYYVQGSLKSQAGIHWLGVVNLKPIGLRKKKKPTKNPIQWWCLYRPDLMVGTGGT